MYLCVVHTTPNSIIVYIHYQTSTAHKFNVTHQQPGSSGQHMKPKKRHDKMWLQSSLGQHEHSVRQTQTNTFPLDERVARRGVIIGNQWTTAPTRRRMEKRARAKAIFMYTFHTNFGMDSRGQKER